MKALRGDSFVTTELTPRELGPALMADVERVRNAELQRVLELAGTVKQPNESATGGEVEMYWWPPAADYRNITLEMLDAHGELEFLYVAWEPTLRAAVRAIDKEVRRHSQTGFLAKNVEYVVSSTAFRGGTGLRRVTPSTVPRKAHWVGIVSKAGYARRFEPEWGLPFETAKTSNSIFELALKGVRRAFGRSVMSTFVTFLPEVTVWPDTYDDPYDRVPVLVIRAPPDHKRLA